MPSPLDELDNAVMRVRSPDGDIMAVWQDGALELMFREGAYDDYREHELQSQLSHLLDSLANGYQQAFNKALQACLSTAYVTDDEPASAPHRRFRAAVSQAVADGFSDRTHVFIQHTGTHNWRSIIRDGTLQTLDETEFATEFASAYRAVNLDYQGKVALARAEHYGTPRRTHRC